MAKKWTIKGVRKVNGVDSTVDIAVVHNLEYHNEWMGRCFVNINVKSSEPIDWHFDDYLIYRGETFSISYDPNVVKKARRGTYDEGFTYDNIKFYSIGDKARLYGFRDVVLNPNAAANTHVYTSLATFSFFCSSIEDFADRLQANLDRDPHSSLVTGWKVLTPIFDRTTQRGVSITKSEWLQYFEQNDNDEIKGETDVNIDIDKQNCFDVMKMSYEKFGLAYYVIGTTIVIGGKPIHLNTGSENIFRYGKGLGLYEIERTSDEDIEIVTKLFAYGSEQNLPLNYYANKGKKVCFNVACKSEREYISGHPILNLWTNKTLSLLDLKNIFGASQRVTLKAGNTTISATVSADTYAMGPERDDPTLPHDVEYVYFSLPRGSAPDYDDTEARAFYNSVSIGSKIYILNADVNKAPSDWIEIPQDYDYPAALSVNKLMLPGFPDTSLLEWVVENHPELLGKYEFSQDKKDPWIKSKNITVAGLFEGTVYYDGSQQKEIYPTIENTEAGVVVADTEITDNGYIEGGSIAFTLKVADSILDWEYALNTAIEDVYIEMKSGFCVGRRFKVNSAKKENGVWVLNADREKDTSSGRYFPYFENNDSKYAQVLNGNTFVVTGIQMPDSYIESASEKLLIAACGYIDKRDHMRYTYVPKIDELFMQRDYDKRGDASYYSTICAGMKMEFEDTDLGIWHTPYIDQLTIKENGNNGIPTFEVVLRDEKEKGTLEKMAERIEELTGATQIVERQSYPSMNIDYAEWVSGTPYYYQTLNTNPNPDISTRPYIETSYVWHRYKKWMCLRTLTQEEPKLGCNDWKVVEGNTNFIGEITTSNGNVFRNGNVDTTLTMKVWWGDEDVTEQIMAIGHQFAWSRYTGYDSETEQFVQQSEDLSWEPDIIEENKIHIVRGDMGSGWMIDYRQALIACLVTFSLTQGEQTDVLGSYRF